ncbi:MAG: 50S ribosome-binding GTPase [Phycisphaerales bacterium]|nr:50S ribosome-binding GTPase [Phycisphaerales bacterium]
MTETPVVTETPVMTDALRMLAGGGPRLRERYAFEWPPQHDHAAYRLRVSPPMLEGACLAAVVGGASSGKSTLFNNLLGGRCASRVTARGHATLGPILAAHESRQALVERLLGGGWLWPTLKHSAIEMDANETGSPASVLTVFHEVDELRDVLLVDTADFTSEDARSEGDLTLSLLPWFDRLIVVIDHERWFDRQSISELKRHASRLGQDRFVVFNRTQEGPLDPAQRELLEQQAKRLGADESLILEFRRGRGFCRFPPGTLDAVLQFLQKPPSSRAPRLLRRVAEGARDVLNQNSERTARLAELRAALRQGVVRALPRAGDALHAVMTAAEREHLDVVSRVLKLRQTREWLGQQRQRLDGWLRHVPFMDILRGKAGSGAAPQASKSQDRATLAESYFEQTARRLAHDAQRSARQSAFWIEMRRWTREEPPASEFEWTPELKERVATAAAAIDDSLNRWKLKVDAECQGAAPLLAGGVAVLLLLAALPGPLTAIPLGAVFAALGAGAVGAKPVGRLTSVARERLLGTHELAEVRQSVQRFLTVLEDDASRRAEQQALAASRWVLTPDDPLFLALTRLDNAREDES